MRNPITLSIVALLALVAFASADVDFDNSVKCGRRFPQIQIWFSAFCRHPHDGDFLSSRGGMMVPSNWAHEGLGHTGLRGNRFRLAVESSCQPAQWVPYKWCMSQFNAMCANTKNKWGYQTQHFGESGCQKFIIGPRKSPEKYTLPSSWCRYYDRRKCKKN